MLRPLRLRDPAGELEHAPVRAVDPHVGDGRRGGREAAQELAAAEAQLDDEPQRRREVRCEQGLPALLADLVDADPAIGAGDVGLERARHAGG
jgi:hypothetical protein